MPTPVDAPLSGLRSRQPRRLLALLTLLSAAACGSPAEPPIRVVDLVARFDAVDARPRDGRFELTALPIHGEPQPVILAPAASRLTWTFAPLPRRARLRSTVGVPAGAGAGRVAFRVGISDGRTYETLADVVVGTDEAAGGTPVEVDLSKYAGPQWSLFYRPDTRRWELILASTVLDGTPAVVYWAAPGIDTDRAAARRFHETRQSGGR
jgi:hypothetical protein